MRVTAFSGNKDKKSILALGAVKVVNSRDLATVTKWQHKFNTVITCLPHTNPKLDKAFQGLAKPFGKFVQVGIPSKNGEMALDHLSLVFFGKELIGQCVCSRTEYTRMMKICDMNKILPISEVYSWQNLPKAFKKLKYGKPHFRCCVSVGKWARKNGFHKK